MIYQKKKYYMYAVLLLAPALVIYTVFLIMPLFQSLQQSFYDWNGIFNSPLKFVGLSNYEKLFSDKEFYRALLNSLYFIIGSVVVELPISFILALIINSNIKGIRFFKTAFFIPVILPVAAVGLMWNFILAADGGLLNELLTMMGLGSFANDWLSDPDTAIVSVVLVNMWIFAGLNMLIFSSGMAAIPKNLYEAADIDGANTWHKIRNITIPLLKRTFVVFSVLAVTGSLRTFDLVFVMTKGGPNGASNVPALYLYNEAFRYDHYGVGNAAGAVIFILGVVISALMNIASNRNSGNQKNKKGTVTSET